MMRFVLVLACSMLCVCQVVAQPLQIDARFGVQMQFSDDWTLLSENLYSSLLQTQLFASGDEKYYVYVEKYGMLHELTKETWLEGRGAPMSHADEARQLEEEAWPFKRPLFKPALIPTYPQGVELFWAEASNFIAYVAFISREASFVKVSVSASKEEHVPDEVALKELLATMSFLPELPQLTHDPYTEADRLMLLERDHEMALEYYKRVPADHPEYVKARRIIGYSILGNSMGKWDEAVPYVEEAYKLAPDDPKVAEDIGRVYLKVGREEEGIALLKQAGTPRANQVLESLGN